MLYTTTQTSIRKRSNIYPIAFAAMATLIIVQASNTIPIPRVYVKNLKQET